jgi:hypothetical protein
MSKEALLGRVCNPHHLNQFDIYERHSLVMRRFSEADQVFDSPDALKGA